MTITEITEKAKAYCEIQALIKQLDGEAEALKAKMIEELKSRDTDTLQADVFNIKWVTYCNNRIDTAALKKAFPDIAAEFTKQTVMRRFQITV